MGQADQVHAVWYVTTNKGVSISVYYARLDLVEGLWNDIVLLEEKSDGEGFFGPSFPVIVDTGENVIVMYNSGNPDAGGLVPVGRPVQRASMSSDGGRTWREATTAFPRHLGRSGEHSLVVDSNKVVHALFMQRIENPNDGEDRVIDGPWHSALSGDQWSEPDNFSTRWSPHDLRAVVVQGNVILLTWRQDPGEGQSGVWYSYLVLDAPELPVAPLPAPQSTPTATPTPTPTPTPTSAPSTPTPIPLQPLASSSQGPLLAGLTDSPAIPLVLGLAPAILIMGGFIAAHQLFSRRRR